MTFFRQRFRIRGNFATPTVGRPLHRRYHGFHQFFGRVTCRPKSVTTYQARFRAIFPRPHRLSNVRRALHRQTIISKVGPRITLRRLMNPTTETDTWVRHPRPIHRTFVPLVHEGGRVGYLFRFRHKAAQHVYQGFRTQGTRVRQQVVITM